MRPIELKSLTLRPYGRTKMLIEWEFAPTLVSFSDYKITLQRSEHPEAGYKNLTTVMPSSNSYIDDDIRIFRFWKDIYVRMHVEALDGSDDYHTKPVMLGYPPDSTALEFIRRLNITLENKYYGTGVPTYAFLRKHGGPTCPECYDPLKRRVIKSQCRSCYTVGYVDGFYAPIKLWVAFTPDSRQVVLTDRGSDSKSEHNAYTSVYPKLNSGDLIYDPRLARLWTVEHVSNVERRRHMVKQNLLLSEVEKSSAFYLMCEERIREGELDV